MVFHLSLRDKSPRVSRTLLSILTDLNKSVVWIVSIRSSISNSFSPLSKPSGTVSSPLTTICVILMYHSFLSSLEKSKLFGKMLSFKHV